MSLPLFLALRRLAKCGYIRNVLRSSRRDLRGHEVGQGNKVRREAGCRIDDALNALFPSLVKINAVDLRQDVHRNRVAAQAEKLATLAEIAGGESLHWCAELHQGRIDRFRVLGIRLNQKVDVFRDAGLRVERNSVAPHDEVFNAEGVEDGQEFFEVWVHPRQRPSSHKWQESF